MKLLFNRFILKNTHKLFLMLILLTLCILVFAQDEEDEQITTGPLFEDFEIIWQRNIFDPTRRAERPEPVVERPVQVVNEFTLIGTLVTDVDSYAFFEGNRSQYNKVVKEGEPIDDFVIQSIATSSIELVSGDQRIPMPVGELLQKEGDQGWKLHDQSDRPSNRKNESSDSLAANANDKQNEKHSDETNDVLQRLMQQRQQELNQ